LLQSCLFFPELLPSVNCPPYTISFYIECFCLDQPISVSYYYTHIINVANIFKKNWQAGFVKNIDQTTPDLCTKNCDGRQ